MGALESKRWSELPPETPQKPNSLAQPNIDDPRSPAFQYNRTPILLQEYDESPQNITARAELQDPRSPSVKITRTPLNMSKKDQESEEDDVFHLEAKNMDGFINPAFNSSNVTGNSPVISMRRKEKNGLKNTTSPGDFKRKNRINRGQSLPQKLFLDKASILPRSPLAQRNHSLPADDTSVMAGRNKKFSFVHKKKSLISEDAVTDKENSVEQVVL